MHDRIVRLYRATMFSTLLCAGANYASANPETDRESADRLTSATALESNGFADCIASYAEGMSGWCKVSDDVFDNVRLSDAEADSLGVKGSTGSKAVMVAWNGAALDPDNLTMYFFGGGHNDYYGNEWYAYDIKAGKFERLNDPSPLDHYYFSTNLNQYCRIPDPAVPASAHTYDGLGFNVPTGTIIMVNQGYSQLCGARPATGTEVNGTQIANIYEFNPSKTEVRNGLQPLTYRNHGRHNYQYPRSVIKDGEIMLGGNLQMFRHAFVDGLLTQQDYVFRNPPAGDGVADKLAGTSERVTYMNAGYMWGFWRSELGWPNYIRNTRIPNSGGMACGDGECLFWSGESNVTVWNPSAPNTYTDVKHTIGPTGGDSRVYSKLQYIPDYDVYIGVSNVNQPVWLYKVAETTAQTSTSKPGQSQATTPSPNPQPGLQYQSKTATQRENEFLPQVTEATVLGEGLQNYQLELNIEGNGPFSLGVGLPKGATDRPGYPNAQTVCRVRWNDGSCKFAVVAGYAGEVDSLASTGISIDIDGAIIEPGIPFYTERGPYMVENWYREMAGDLLVLFYVQQFSQGERHVTIAVENGYVNYVTAQAQYSATVTVGDQSKEYQISQARNTRWVAEFFDGQFAKASQDVKQLVKSGLVPNYPLSSDATPGSYQNYAPMDKGDHTASMGAGGYQPQIGILPKWDAAYLANPSAEAYSSVIANAYAIGSYRIVWRDIDTGRILEPEKFGKWTVQGENQGGVNQLCGSGLCWERAHFPSTGYLAYLLTGNPVHLDTLGHTASTCYLVQTWGNGGGVGEQRLDLLQTRGQAWCWRAAGMYAALTGDNGLTDRFAYNMASYVARVGVNELGISYDDRAYGVGVIGPWQHNFRVQTLGFLSDIDPLDDMSDLIALRDFNYKFPIGLLQDRYCRAGLYTFRAGDTDMTGLNFRRWSKIYLGEPCAGELADSPSATNYWANLLPAISYAVKHRAEGADDAWRRVKAAANFNSWMGSFNQNPVWGVAFPLQFTEDSASEEQAVDSRDYLPGWDGLDDTCIDTRNRLLAIESLKLPAYDDFGCRVTSGLWQDPYTGDFYTDPGDLEIDHLVPLREALNSGAEIWQQDRFQAYAIDSLLADALVVMSASTYLSKGFDDPALWMPPDSAYHCQYVRDWVAVKSAYGLDIDTTEASAIESVLQDSLQHATRPTQNGIYLDGEESRAKFSIGLTRDGECAYYTDATIQDLVHITVSITPELQDRGKAIEVFLIAQVEEQLYSVTPSRQLIPINADLKQLVAFDSGIFWKTFELTLFEGYMDTPLDLQIFVAYWPDGGDFVYTPLPTRLYIY